MVEFSASPAPEEAQHWLQRGGSWAMAEEGEKVRYAMAIFEDMPRLRMAASALLRMGLDPRNLCVAGEPAAVENGKAEVWPGPEQRPVVIPLQHSALAVGVLPAGAILWRADTPVLKALEAWGLSDRFPTSSIWDALRGHLSKGALLLIALVPSAALQDQAMRTLLRTSHHPVHSEEFLRIG